MKRLLNITAATAVASLALTGTAQASSDSALNNKMLATCMQQFVASNFADYAGKVTVQEPDTSDSSYTSKMVAGRGYYHVKVAAVGRPSGKQYATATCKMTRDGSVVSIKTAPLAAMKTMQRVEPVVVATNAIK